MRHAFEVKRLVGLLVCVGFLLGMDTASLSLFLGTDYFKEYFNNPNEMQTGMMTGANQIGGFFGCLLSGTLLESIGCRWCLSLCSVIWSIGSIVSLFVNEVYTMALGRFIKGLAVGVLSVLASFYLMEVFSTNIRGQATALLQMALTVSILIIYFTSMALDKLQSPLSFKITWGLELIPSIVLFGLFQALPESPNWLHKHGHSEQSIDRSLQILRIKDLKKFKEEFINVNRISLKISHIVKKGYWKHMSLGIIIQILIQMSGINVIMYYMMYICEMMGFDEEISSKLTAGPYIVNVLFTLIPVFLIDKFNRKVFIGWAGLFLGAIMLAIGMLIGERERHVGDVVLRNIAVALCFLFVSVFSSSLSCAGFVYTNEILPESIKSVALSVCISTSWITGFFLALVTPKLMQMVEWWIFIILGTSTIALSTIVVLWFPETKGLSSIEVEMLFDRKEKYVAEVTSEKFSEDTTTDNISIPDRSGAPEPDYFASSSTHIEILGLPN